MIRESFVLNKKSNHPILGDILFESSFRNVPIVIFCHGYKGYKDWGAWNLMSEELVNKGFCVVKFNFSHNGGAVDNPIDFPDLKAFSENTYTKELNDLGDVIDWIFSSSNQFQSYYNKKKLTLIGHSRGGGISILKASEDDRIKRLVTLAAVSDFKSRFPKGDELLKWRAEEVRFVLNGRTKQNMPHLFQFYTDFIENEDRLTISKAESNLKIPHIIFHGDDDEAVNVSEAIKLKEWNPNAELRVIKGANHTFGSYHPYDKDTLPDDLLKCLEF